MPKNGRPLRESAPIAWRSAPPPRSSAGRAGAERALAGHDQLVGARDDVGVGADDRLGADGGQRLLDAAQVAAPEIGDDDAAVDALTS